MKQRAGMSIINPRKLDFVTSIDSYEKYKKLSCNILDKLSGIIGMPHIRHQNDVYLSIIFDKFN